MARLLARNFICGRVIVLSICDFVAEHVERVRKSYPESGDSICKK